MMIRCLALLALLAAALLAVPVGAATAQTVTSADIERLQDGVFQAGTDVSQLRSRDSARAGQLQVELDELRDEVIYLKVKLRKEGRLEHLEYSQVRDRIERLRSGSLVAPSPAVVAPPPTAARPANELPAGTEFEVRLINSLNSGTAMVEDRFEASTLVDVSVGGRVLIPAGAIVRGIVTAVDPGTRTNRTAKMTVSFDRVTVGARAYPIRATVSEAIKGGGVRGEAGRLGAGAGVGAILGGIFGGAKGALAGVLIGGGGTIAATEGKEVELAQGTQLRVRMDSPALIGE
jgi:hypothetical protein